MVEKKKILFILLLILLIVLPEFRLSASGRIKFRRLALADGLSQNSVYSILQDSVGFMWFGTEDGLNRYDGYEFKIYKPDPGDPESIGSNQISSLYEDSAGNLWIGTYGGGLNRFDREQDKFIQYRHRADDNRSLSSDKVTAVWEDQAGVLWVGTDDGGLNRLNRDNNDYSQKKKYETFTRFRSGGGPETPSGLSSNSIMVLCEDHSGILWIGTRDGGLCRFDRERENFKYYRANPGDTGSLNSDNILSLYEDHAGELWVGTNRGLHLFERTIERFIRYTHNPEKENSLSDNHVQVIYEDHTGVLWVGTDTGLNRFDRRSERFTRYRNEPGNPNSLSLDTILDIYESRAGVMWFGTDGGGINIIDRQGEKFRHYWSIPGNPDSLSNNIVFNVEEDAAGILWIATSGGGLNRFDPEENRFRWYRNDPGDPASLSNDVLRDIHIDAKGRFWIATLGGGLNRFFPETGTFKHYRSTQTDTGVPSPTGLTSDQLRSIYEDRAGKLWLGSDDGGLCVFDPETETFNAYFHRPGDPGSLSNDGVRAVHQDREGIFWIGTYGGGVNRFDPNTETFTRFQPKPGDSNSLGSNFVAYIHEDKKGRLWFCTMGSGLDLYHRETGTFKHYRQKDGLPNDVTYAMLEDDAGNLWISTNYGLTKFDPTNETFKNYTVKDGLQSNEFNGRSCFKSRNGRMFFGGINGLTAFYPERVRDNVHIPPIVISDFLVLNKPVTVGKSRFLDKHITKAKTITLTYKQNVFSFEFVALDYTIPEKNRYAYMLEGFDRDWIYTSAKKRFVTYTNLDAGQYIFRVRGSNNDGVWNQEGASVKVVILPQVWKTWWFTLLALALSVATAVMLYKKRMKNLAREMRLQAGQQSIRDAQVEIMPQGDPKVSGFDISGDSIPGGEVAGDFFDYIWLDEEKTRFGIAVGDVSAKTPKEAVTAIMSDGIFFSPAGESGFIKEKMAGMTRPCYFKTPKSMFTALCLATLNVYSKEMAFTAAGPAHPVLKNGVTGEVSQLREEETRFPPGGLKEQKYKEKGMPLKNGDVLLLFTDGVYGTQNSSGEHFEYKALEKLLEETDTIPLSASEIKRKVLEEVREFAGNVPQHDDIVLVVVKVR